MLFIADVFDRPAVEPEPVAALVVQDRATKDEVFIRHAGQQEGLGFARRLAAQADAHRQQLRFVVQRRDGFGGPQGGALWVCCRPADLAVVDVAPVVEVDNIRRQFVGRRFIAQGRSHKEYLR